MSSKIHLAISGVIFWYIPERKHTDAMRHSFRREGLCRGNQGGGCHGCHEGRHVGEGGSGQSHEDGSSAYLFC